MCVVSGRGNCGIYVSVHYCGGVMGNERALGTCGLFLLDEATTEQTPALPHAYTH